MDIACGLDVHKDSIFACILNDSGVLFQEKFGVTTPSLIRLAETISLYSCSDVCMESTSIYWIPVKRILESRDLSTVLVNPYFIKQLPGKKSDVKDAEWIATCLKKGLVSGSYVPEERIQELRQLNRRISDINSSLRRCRVKLDASLQRCNIRISNYVASTSSKGYMGVVEKISEGVTDPAELLRCIHGRTKNRFGETEILAALTGIISQVDVAIISQLRDEILMLGAQRGRCISMMESMCKEHFPEQMEHLLTIPGVKPRTATCIIAEVGSEVGSFKDPEHLCSWAGLAPRNDESAGKIKYRGITHGNKYLRQALIEAAMAAARTQGTAFSRFSYTQTVVRRKNVMKVRVAIARKILVAIWYILHDNTPYIEPKGRIEPDEEAAS